MKNSIALRSLHLLIEINSSLLPLFTIRAESRNLTCTSPPRPTWPPAGPRGPLGSGVARRKVRLSSCRSYRRRFAPLATRRAEFRGRRRGCRSTAERTRRTAPSRWRKTPPWRSVGPPSDGRSATIPSNRRRWSLREPSGAVEDPEKQSPSWAGSLVQWLSWQTSNRAMKGSNPVAYGEIIKKRTRCVEFAWISVSFQLHTTNCRSWPSLVTLSLNINEHRHFMLTITADIL